MQTVSIYETPENLEKLFRSLGTDPIFVIRDGEAVAMISPPRMTDRERAEHWDNFYRAERSAKILVKANSESA